MKEFDQLNTTIKKLRSPGGCPWDRAQTVQTMKRYLLEEAYELHDAIGKKRPNDVKEELGDIFLILIVLSHMYSEKGVFTVKDVLKAVNEKLIVRHPHVFSTKKLKTTEEVLQYWVATKAKKKKRKTIKCRLPLSAPALMLAAILNKERAHLSAKENPGRFATDIVTSIQKASRKLNAKKVKKEVFSSLLFDLGRLGFLLNLDLEEVLREKVLSEARATPYRTSKK